MGATKIILIYLGIAVATKINSPEIKADLHRRKEFMDRTKDFLVASVLQIKKRWDNDGLIKIALLSPKTALNKNVRDFSFTMTS